MLAFSENEFALIPRHQTGDHSAALLETGGLWSVCFVNLQSHHLTTFLHDSSIREPREHAILCMSR